MRTETAIIPRSLYLGDITAVEAKLSDHNLLIRGRTLFLNMMMQGRYNAAKHRYNNGFAFVESDKDYQIRIRHVVRLLAEAVSLNPHITMIGLAEAPIKMADIAAMIDEARKQPSLRPFMSTFVPQSFTEMGIATLVNSDVFSVEMIAMDPATMRPSLRHRVQKLALSAHDGSESLTVVTLHLPYDLAKSPDPSDLITFSKQLFVEHKRQPVLVMGDFNIYPKKIAKQLTDVASHIQKDNNVLIRADEKGNITHTELDTVDAIMQSARIKEQNRAYNDSRSCSNKYVDLHLQHRLFASAVTKPSAKVEEVEDLIPQAVVGG
ncbi:MAG: hypothetical protein P1U40_04215 [Coxiellaceae bacterium]|nr:hypothetical protein [Coxiellaceae bacterium]